MTVSPEGSSDLSRRSVLRRAAAVGLMATPAAGILAACGTEKPADNTGGGEVSDKNPFGMKEDSTTEIVIFNGGYGEKYATDGLTPNFKTAWPKAQVKHTATNEISPLVQPRFQGGNPPEFVNNSGTKSMDFGALVADGQLEDLTKFWDSPAPDQPGKKLKDIVLPGTIEAGSFNGKPYVLYYVSTAFGLWYSGKLFKDNGWTPAKTWDEFLTLLDKIKAKGITPYGYAGANAAYYQVRVILTHAAKIGGEQILKDIDNLKAGAWKADAVLKAAEAWGSLFGKGFMDKGHEGLKHTEVQLQQNQYKVGLYPSGDWLEGEQAKTTPADFMYQVAAIPSLTSSDKLSAAAVQAAAGEGYFVTSKSKNKAGGLEYMRQMLSKSSARKFTEITEAHAVTVVAGAAEGYAFPPGAQSSQAAVKAAGKDLIGNYFFDGWYDAIEKETRVATNDLMFGRSSAAQWAERIQKKADEIAADKSVTKFQR